MVSVDFRRQLEGYGLTTASILYHLPDHPGILAKITFGNSMTCIRTFPTSGSSWIFGSAISRAFCIP